MSNFHWDDINVKVDDSCPIATSDISVNLKNRQKAIDTAGYGPLNPTKPNNEFWDAKAERWNVTADDARDQKCGNCAAFIQTKRMLDCIDKGLGNESGNSAWDVINAGDLGYCEAFDFKCASSRTCDAWIVGGPITEEKENNMEEKSLEDMYSELLAIEEKSLEDTYLELLAIEEKAGLIVPVRPDPKPFRPTLERRRGQRPQRPGPVGGMGMGRYKAEEEDEPEEDMLYDEEYVGDDEDDKAMMRPGGAGSPRDASDRQRGQQFMNWASGRSPSGDNVHPTSVGNMDIGDSGRRSVANSRMTDLMRNRSWTNPRPRPGVGSRATATNTGPAKKPNIQPAPLPTQNYKPKNKPKDWGSDNNAQLISGATSGFDNTSKSAWDEEAYYEYDYDFDMKKLPMGGGGNRNNKRPTPMPTSNPGSPRDASDRQQFRQFADHLNANDVGGPGKGSVAASRQAGLKKYVGDVAIGAAGPSSSSPVGDNRGVAKPKQYLARSAKNPGSPQAAAESNMRDRYIGAVNRNRAANSPSTPRRTGLDKETATNRPKRGPGNPGKPSPTSFPDYLRGNDLGQSKGRSAAVGRRGASIRQAAYDIAGSEGPKRGPQKINRGPSSVDRPNQQMPRAFNQAIPRQPKPSQGSLGERMGGPRQKPSQGGLERAMRRQNKPSQSLLGENFSKSYDQGYEYDEYDEYLYQKSYDQGYDEYDEYEDYIDFKGMTDEQAAGLRAAGQYFSGRNTGGSAFGSADTMASRGMVRRSAALQKFGSEGPKRGASRPAMMNKPKTQSRTGSADTAAARIGGFTTGGSRFTYSKPSTTDWSKPIWSRYGKASDEEMYWDDEDEMAIPPDTDDKALTDEQAAGLRAAGQYFGDKDKGKERIQKFYSDTQSMGKATADLYRGPTGAIKPRPIRGPGGTGHGAGSTRKPNTGMSNKPNTIRPTRDAAPRAPRPKMNTPRPGMKKPASSGGGGDRSIAGKFGYAGGKIIDTFNPFADHSTPYR
jgi:hypothetical protein